MWVLVRFILPVVVVGLVGCARQAYAFSPDQLVLTTFSLVHDTGFGNSVFVGGDVPELGGGSLPLAPKLTWNPGNHWTAAIGLPPASTVSYRLWQRSDSYANIGDPGNGSPLSEIATTTTAAGPGGPLALSKSLYYRSGWPNVNLMVESAITSGSYTSHAMEDIGPGRSSGERLWRATGFGVPGRMVRFYLETGTGATDPATSATTPYATYLDQALLQDGHLYNYVPAPTVSSSRIEVVPNVASPQGLQSRALRVYLPRGYDEHTTRRYPVLYMHDGDEIYGMTGPEFPFDRWNADATLNEAIRQGQVRELIVVGIDNTSDRLAEYTPPNAPPGGLAGGTGNKYAEYVRDTVKPLIDSTYRTLPDRANTGVGGCSLGGLISTYMALEQPETWSRIGAFSPAYWAHEPAVSDRFASEPTLPVWRHFFSCGTGGDASSGSPDGYNLTIASRDALLRRGQVYNVHVLNEIGIGEQHNQVAWRNRFPGAIRFLFPIEDEPVELTPLNAAVGEWERY